MRERRTVRLLLLDPRNRLCLMKIEDAATGDGKPKWVTLGGRLEEGESLHEAATREAAEETGQADIEIGPVVWVGEQVLRVRGEDVLFRESFVVARAKSADLERSGWTAEERVAIREMRWWTVEEMLATADTILPRIMPMLLPEVIAGNYPALPKVIEL